MVAACSEPKAMVEVVPEFLRIYGCDEATRDLIRPGLEFHFVRRGQNVRIPKHRNGDAPCFAGELVTPDELHISIERLGTTGWNWQLKQTEFVILDFDAMDHAAGRPDEILDEVIAAAKRLGWCWVRRSKGGKGIHIVVPLSEPLPAATGEQHAANAKAVVTRMCKDAEFDFMAHVDCFGQVGYVYAKTVAEHGFEVLVRPSCESPDIDPSSILLPPRKQGKVGDSAIECADDLLPQHLDDIAQMQDAGYVANFTDGKLHCHSKGFEVLYADTSRPGRYSTTSAGSNPRTPNSFAFPLCDGGWSLNRFNVHPESEAEMWVANAKGFASTTIRPPFDFDDDFSVDQLIEAVSIDVGTTPAVDVAVPAVNTAESASSPQKATKSKSPTKKKPEHLLIEYASRLEQCHTPERVPVLIDRMGKRRHTFLLPDKEFEGILAERCFSGKGIVPSGGAIQNAMRIVENACLNGPCRRVYSRVGYHEGAVYIDLADELERVIKITSAGWSVESECPVLMLRSKNISPMPQPVRGGRLDELKPFLNVTEDQWPVVVSFLLACWSPFGPFPLLMVHGPAGSAKTSTCRFIQGIVDSKVDFVDETERVFGPPKNVQDLMVAATTSWTQCFDNVREISDPISDALCRLSTGGAMVARKLYTDNTPTMMSAKRPVVISSITDVISSEDLRSRTMFLELSMLENVTGEIRLVKNYAVARPRIMGALADCIVLALRYYETTAPLPGNRLADTTSWIMAAEAATGLSPGRLAASLRNNRRDSVEALADTPLVQSLIRLAKASPDGLRVKAEQLRGLLGNEGVSFDNAGSLGIRLTQITTEVRTAGLVLKRDKRHWIVRWVGTDVEPTAVSA